MCLPDLSPIQPLLSTSPVLSMEWLKNAYCTRPSKVSLSLLISSLYHSAPLHQWRGSSHNISLHPPAYSLPRVPTPSTPAERGAESPPEDRGNSSQWQPTRSTPSVVLNRSSHDQHPLLTRVGRSTCDPLTLQGTPHNIHSSTVSISVQKPSLLQLWCLLWKRWPSIRSSSTHIRMFSSTYKCLNPIPTSLVPILESKCEWNSLLSTLTLSFIISCMLYP